MSAGSNADAGNGSLEGVSGRQGRMPRAGVPGGIGGGQMSAEELRHLDNLIDKWRGEGKSIARELDQRGLLCSPARMGYIEGRIATMLAEDLAVIPAHVFKHGGITPTNPLDMKRAIEVWLAREAKEISG
jgi:hypothetical protein